MDPSDSVLQILIYLHYFNGAIVDGCPLSRAGCAARAGKQSMVSVHPPNSSILTLTLIQPYPYQSYSVISINAKVK